MWPLVVTLLIAAGVGVAAAVTMLSLASAPTAPERIGGSDAGSELHAPASHVVALPFIALALGVIVAALGALMILIERSSVVAGWDTSVERWASEEAGQQATTALTWITHLGDTLTVAALVGLTVLWVLVTRRDWPAAGFLISVAVGQLIIVNTVKWAFDRGRPELEPLATFSGASFPSGHTTAAASVYLAIALVLAGYVHHRWKAVLIGAALGVGVAVACSRALLGVHWLTDVVGGLILGWSWCLICWALFAPRGPVHALWGPFRRPRTTTSSAS